MTKNKVLPFASVILFACLLACNDDRPECSGASCGAVDDFGARDSGADTGQTPDTNMDSGQALDQGDLDAADAADMPLDTAVDAGNRQNTPLVAFVGAEGFGAVSVGGRAGRVIYVTNLNDSGEGSLRAAVSAAGPRTVVFRTAGTIMLRSPISVSEPYLTIAGQTAPGGGIALRIDPANLYGSSLLQIDTHDVVVRHLRFRRGPGVVGECCGDSVAIGGGSKIIFDHVSISWSTDELFDAWPGNDVTIQDSILSEGLTFSTHIEDGELKNHSFAAIIGNSSDRVSFIRNVFTQVRGRAPYFAPTAGGAFELVNNLVHNTCYSSELSSRGPRANFNAIGNRIIPGDDTCGRGRNNLILTGDVRVYVEDNLTPYRDAGEDEWMATSFFGSNPPADPELRAETPFALPTMTSLQAAELENRLLPSVGATQPMRDSVDARVIEDIRTRTANHIADPSEVGGWPDLSGGAPYTDDDRDGMDDQWEALHGLVVGQADDAGDADGDGYTNLEEFLNGTLP